MLFDFRRGKMMGWKGRRGRCAKRGDRPFTCVCPECGRDVPHQSGAPCFQTKCPRCGSPMARRFVIEE